MKTRIGKALPGRKTQDINIPNKMRLHDCVHACHTSEWPKPQVVQVLSSQKIQMRETVVSIGLEGPCLGVTQDDR